MPNMNDNNDNSKTNQGFLHEGHKAPVTRREFLSQGILGFSGMIALPTFLGLSFRKAYGAECGAQSANPVAVSFMVFDMAGGAALPGNFLVGGKGGPKDYLSSYDRLGWDPKAAGALNEDFGLPLSAKSSQILQGILTTSSVEARKNLRMGSLCHFAQDDTSTNRLNAGTLILKASQPGLFIGTGLGLKKTASGGNSDPVINELALKPTYIEDIGDLTSATKFGGAPYATLSKKQLKALATGAVKLGGVQSANLMGFTGGPTLADLSKCAYDKSLEFLDGVAGLDPRQDAKVATAYGINAQTNSRDPKAISAALAMNAIKGFSGPAVWTLGGCDYHDGTQTTGDGKDLAMGQEIGRAVETAFQLKRPFFFQLLTDGGVDAQPGSRQWRGDSGDKCMTVLGFYNPKAPVEMERLQVGHYTDGQGADRSTLVGSSPALVAYAVLANYLNCFGMLSKFNDYAPGIFTGAGELKSVLLFKETKV